MQELILLTVEKEATRIMQNAAIAIDVSTALAYCQEGSSNEEGGVDKVED